MTPSLSASLAQRFHRWGARASFDPADVPVGDAGRGEVALRQSALAPQAMQTPADTLALWHRPILAAVPPHAR